MFIYEIKRKYSIINIEKESKKRYIKVYVKIVCIKKYKKQ